MEKTYLGQIEQGITKVMVYYIDSGYFLEFYTNDRVMA